MVPAIVTFTNHVEKFATKPRQVRNMSGFGLFEVVLLFRTGLRLG